MKFFLSLLLAFILLTVLVPAANAHRPYVKELSDWISYDGKEYRLEGWFGDGIFFADPLRVILRSKDGKVSGITDIGKSPKVDCRSLDNCWVFLEPRTGSGLLSLKLNPKALSSIKSPEEHGGGPKDWTGGIVGFEAKEHPGGALYHHAGKIILLIMFTLLIATRYLINKRRKRRMLGT